MKCFPLLAASPSSPRLLDQVRERIRVKHYSLRTAQAYLKWIKRDILFHDKPLLRDSVTMPTESRVPLGQEQMESVRQQHLRDRVSGVVRRHRLDEWRVQRAVRKAAEAAGAAHFPSFVCHAVAGAGLRHP